MTEDFLDALIVWVDRKQQLDNIRSDATKNNIGYFYRSEIEGESDARRQVQSKLEDLIDSRVLAALKEVVGGSR